LTEETILKKMETSGSYSYGTSGRAGGVWRDKEHSKSQNVPFEPERISPGNVSIDNH
jgi:hypothetical protein